MLDKPEKTRDLIAILEAALPFEVALMPELIGRLARQEKPVVLKPIETVSKISYLGDMGGIVCCVQPEDTESMIVVSLTHVRVSRKLPFATAVLDISEASCEEAAKTGLQLSRQGSARDHFGTGAILFGASTMDINKFDVIVWVRKTNSFPALRNELLRRAGNEPDEVHAATRAWSIFTGASLISSPPSTWPLLSAR